MPSADVAIVAALPIELDPIRDRLTDRIIEQGQFRFDLGQLAGRRVALVESGPGEDNAVRACRAVVLTHRPQWLITAGLAGGLVDRLDVGDVVLAGDVVGGSETASLPFAEFARRRAGESDTRLDRLVTVKHPVLKESGKRELAASTGAHIVDMESYGVAQWCTANGIRCISIRSISDSVTDSLPRIVNALVDANAWEQVGRVAGTMLRRPSVIKELWELRSRALEAADRLAERVAEVVAAIELVPESNVERNQITIEKRSPEENCS